LSGPDSFRCPLLQQAPTATGDDSSSFEFCSTRGYGHCDVVRLLLTFSSSYFRLLSLPEASYGLIGAGLSGLGLVVSPVARWMVRTRTLAENYGLIAMLTLAALTAAACQWPLWGMIFVVPLGAAMMALGFMVSYYLNALVNSHHRATVLSFKGLAFNLCYGFVGLLFAVILKAFQDGTRPDYALSQGFRLLPLWLWILIFYTACEGTGRGRE
jgi:hypothetical protein